MKKILKRYGYPPDKQQKAIDLVLEQAHLIAKDWAEINGRHPGTFDKYIQQKTGELAIAEKSKEYKK